MVKPHQPKTEHTMIEGKEIASPVKDVDKVNQLDGSTPTHDTFSPAFSYHSLSHTLTLRSSSSSLPACHYDVCGYG